ncbi:MAG TPA: hypothetical protein VKV77_13265 [Methylovirgula sp.]|nr:hypothetical protein [Methylovirgula sp.]
MLKRLIESAARRGRRLNFPEHMLAFALRQHCRPSLNYFINLPYGINTSA